MAQMQPQLESCALASVLASVSATTRAFARTHLCVRGTFAERHSCGVQLRAHRDDGGERERGGGPRWRGVFDLVYSRNDAHCEQRCDCLPHFEETLLYDNKRDATPAHVAGRAAR